VKPWKRFLLDMLFFGLGWWTAAGIEYVVAQTLAPVTPPTDWTGVAIVVVLGLIFVAFGSWVVYIYIKLKAGQQFGEEYFDKLAAAFDRRRGAVPPHPVPSAPPLTFDGLNFADEAALLRYKAAKAEFEEAQKGATK